MTKRIMAMLFVLVLSLVARGQEPNRFAPVQERYYVTLFSSEGRPNKARFSHVWATFSKVNGTLECPTFCISWMPASLDIRFRLRPERGVNLGLADTLKWVASVNGKTSAWGPFEVNKVVYDRAVVQYQILQEGRIMYKMVDFRMKYRPHVANNCHHVVTDIIPGGLISTGTAFGQSYGPLLVRHFSPWIIEPQHRNAWVAESLGLTASAVTFR